MCWRQFCLVFSGAHVLGTLGSFRGQRYPKGIFWVGAILGQGQHVKMYVLSRHQLSLERRVFEMFFGWGKKRALGKHFYSFFFWSLSLFLKVSNNFLKSPSDLIFSISSFEKYLLNIFCIQLLGRSNEDIT